MITRLRRFAKGGATPAIQDIAAARDFAGREPFVGEAVRRARFTVEIPTVAILDTDVDLWSLVKDEVAKVGPVAHGLPATARFLGEAPASPVYTLSLDLYILQEN